MKEQKRTTEKNDGKKERMKLYYIMKFHLIWNLELSCVRNSVASVYHSLLLSLHSLQRSICVCICCSQINSWAMPFMLFVFFTIFYICCSLSQLLSSIFMNAKTQTMNANWALIFKINYRMWLIFRLQAFLNSFPFSFSAFRRYSRGESETSRMCWHTYVICVNKFERIYTYNITISNCFYCNIMLWYIKLAFFHLFEKAKLLFPWLDFLSL